MRPPLQNMLLQSFLAKNNAKPCKETWIENRTNHPPPRRRFVNALQQCNNCFASATCHSQEKSSSRNCIPSTSPQHTGKHWKSKHRVTSTVSSPPSSHISQTYRWLASLSALQSPRSSINRTTRPGCGTGGPHRWSSHPLNRHISTRRFYTSETFQGSCVYVG